MVTNSMSKTKRIIDETQEERALCRPSLGHVPALARFVGEQESSA